MRLAVLSTIGDPDVIEHQVLLLPPPYAITRSGDEAAATTFSPLLSSSSTSSPLQHDGSRSQGCPGHCCSSPGSSPGCPCCAAGCHLIRLHQASALLAQFATRSPPIAADLTKFNYVIAALDNATAGKVEAIILSPPTCGLNSTSC